MTTAPAQSAVVPLKHSKAIEFRLLAKGLEFYFTEKPEVIYCKTGQRTARQCHYIRLPVVRVHPRRLVVWHQEPEVR